MAISGKGFFQVTDESGNQYYTRAGDFRPDDTGVLRTPAGLALMGYKYNEDGTKGGLDQVTIDKFAKMPAKATTSVDLRFNVAQSTDNSTDAVNPYFSMLGQYNSANTPPLAKAAYGYSQDITLYDSAGTAHSATIYFDGAPAGTTGSTVEYLIASNADSSGGTAEALMALYMMRSLRVFTDVDLAPEALKKGKLGLKPHILPGGAGPVTRIFTRYKERAKREGVRP